jgi:hypothetical protein
MKKMLLVLCLIALMLSPVFALAADVGLLVNGGGGFIFKPGGASQWLANAAPYYKEAFNQPSYNVLTGQTQGSWNGTWQDGQGNMAVYSGSAESQATAYFGSLGVKSYAWVSEKDGYYDWQTSASANAAFSDVWRISGPSLGTSNGSVTIAVNLTGTRTDPWQNHGTSLTLKLYNYLFHAGAQYGDTTDNPLDAGLYFLTIPFRYGTDNNVAMSLTSGAGSFNEYSGGGVAAFVDFYNTAKVTGLTFRDANGNIVTNYAMTTASGYNYNAVPVPPAVWLLGSGLLGLIGLRRKISG